ncbi:Foldase protein PrsA precursor [Thalassoglobus neptunius]|uniref:Foldase protein PrsA n=1 Tax=Thalassoglobus neptunius TaxID=1938619 RepID=A0A5C5WIZ0_9PLAN|nr:peptidylprolyl isomerase [Thalassoglobus neptunius]TWT50099.1 Foldase protein PrsA precursor [Thalassoglobus neptunius]
MQLILNSTNSPSSSVRPGSCCYFLLSIAVPFMAMIALLSVQPNAFGADDDSQPIASVNRHPVTASQLQLQFFQQAGSSLPVQHDQAQLIEKLIDRELIRQFLEKKKIEADPQVLARRLELLSSALESRGENLDDQLAKLAITIDDLSEMLAFEIAWRTYVTKSLDERRIREFWEANRQSFDGTRVTASQIFLSFPSEATPEDRKRTAERLTDIRKSILSGKVNFAESAREHSDSPSKSQGGRIGSFERYGQVSDDIAKVAFETSPGMISEPFTTEHGAHIVLVEEVTPGDLSLEDARPELINKLAQQMWNERVATERKTARIRVFAPKK